MPIMTVRYGAGDLDATARADLAKRLTEIMIRMEGGANTPGGRAFAWVLFEESAPGAWWAGGEAGDEYIAPPGRYLVRVDIPEGYMNAAHKSEVHAWVTEAILAVRPASGPQAGHSIQVIVNEIPEGNWAAAGRTISLANIAESVGLPKTGSRFAWAKAYFAAKARARAAAGYPADAGGLWADQPR
ncbi:tautomerase family protein [Bosea sp. BK604]|uniref:tautomerase family protein n=1 Tax=Bosea sp. BK604 TaxID=2512180 RepID=UPI0010446884|nr:tautomerase family protein [Bosea sp. BK604]TCR65617.1 phenylpyruvate tautomerase PptA (4-oxalocrotonate tautomerase family) [Bosea sp. BK604]